jgi:hypothetical protein
MQQASGSFRLIVRRGPQPNQIYDLNKDVMTIGRDITNDITINDPECSRHHARLTRDPNGYTIEDLGSTNGTFVNGQRLTGSRVLMPGETLGLGETVTLAYEATTFFPSQTAPAGPPPQPLVRDYAPPKAEVAPSPSPYAPPPPAAANLAPAQTPPPPAYAPPPAATPGMPAPMPYGMPPQNLPPGAIPPGMPIYDPAYAAAYAQYGVPPYGQVAYEEEPAGGGWMRWLLLGCGCFIVLCVIGGVIGLIVIDQTCAWDQEPLVSILDTFGLQADENFSACQS